MGIGKGVGTGREHLDNSHQLCISITLIPVTPRNLMARRILLGIDGTRPHILVVSAEHGDDKNGSDAEAASSCEIDAWVGFRIDGKLGLMGL